MVSLTGLISFMGGLVAHAAMRHRAPATATATAADWDSERDGGGKIRPEPEIYKAVGVLPLRTPGEG